MKHPKIINFCKRKRITIDIILSILVILLLIFAQKNFIKYKTKSPNKLYTEEIKTIEKSIDILIKKDKKPCLVLSFSSYSGIDKLNIPNNSMKNLGSSFDSLNTLINCGLFKSAHRFIILNNKHNLHIDKLFNINGFVNINSLYSENHKISIFEKIEQNSTSNIPIIITNISSYKQFEDHWILDTNLFVTDTTIDNKSILFKITNSKEAPKFKIKTRKFKANSVTAIMKLEFIDTGKSDAKLNIELRNDLGNLVKRYNTQIWNKTDNCGTSKKKTVFLACSIEQAHAKYSLEFGIRDISGNGLLIENLEIFIFKNQL